jgi:hypothetical protein
VGRERRVALMPCRFGRLIVARHGKSIPASGGGNERQLQRGRCQYGIGFGTALAIAISYTNNHSILWSIIHGFFSWFYVIYFALFK